MKNRIVLIQYRDAERRQRAGSGMLVDDRAVLTADHVAGGTSHQVLTSEWPQPVDVDEGKTVRSGRDDVDLAVLILTEPVSGLDLGRTRYARVNRTQPGEITGCVAVGFPQWKKDSRGRRTAQVGGFIRTLDDQRMAAPGGLDGQFLTLEASHLPRKAPPIPDTVDPVGPESPWAGMSGAAVVCGELVLGVICRHYRQQGPGCLALAPLTALKLLDEHKRREFCKVLRIGNIDRLPELPADSGVLWHANDTSGEQARAPELADAVRQRYESDLAYGLHSVGLKVPEHWTYAELDWLHREYRQRVMERHEQA